MQPSAGRSAPNDTPPRPARNSQRTACTISCVMKNISAPIPLIRFRVRRTAATAMLQNDRRIIFPSRTHSRPSSVKRTGRLSVRRWNATGTVQPAIPPRKTICFPARYSVDTAAAPWLAIVSASATVITDARARSRLRPLNARRK